MKKYKLTAHGRKVKKKLIDLNMTQAELAEMVGTTKQYLNDILHGKRSGKKYIGKINKILGIDVAA